MEEHHLPFFSGWWWCSGQTKLYDAVYSNKLCNETWTTFQQCLEAWEICIANVACRDLKNLMFFLRFPNVEAHLNVLRGQFSGPLPLLGPRSITGMVGLFSPLIWGRIRIPSSTRVWFFQGGTQVSKDMFSSYISQVTLNWYGNTCQKKSHLTSAFCVCFTPFVQGLAVSCRCICTLQI